MSVNRPGIAKSSQALVFKKNENRNTSLSSTYNNGTAARPRTTISANLSNIQSRTSVFTSSGAMVSLNPRQALRNVNPHLVRQDNSSLRAGLNQNKGYDIAYMNAMRNAFLDGQRYNNKMSTEEKWMVGLAAVTQLAQVTAAIVDDVKDTKSSSSASSTGSPKKDMSEKDIPTIKLKDGFSSKLDGASSFKDINQLESDVARKEAGLEKDYGSSDVTNSINTLLAQDGVKEGLLLAGVNLDTSKIKLSSLNKNDLDASLDTIDADIKKIQDFISTDLATAIDTAGKKASSIKTDISSLQSSITKLEVSKEGMTDAQKASVDAQIKELKDQITAKQIEQKQVDAAIAQLDVVKAQVLTGETGCIKDLAQMKAEIQDLKEFKAEVQDKKFEMAKSQDKELGQILKQLPKLEKSGKRDGKIEKLTIQMKSLVDSLSNAGGTEFVNSKGSKYTLTNLTAAQNYEPAQSVKPADGDASPAVKDGAGGQDNGIKGKSILNGFDLPSNEELLRLNNSLRRGSMIGDDNLA